MRDWKVLFVKPNCEKKVAEVCAAHGIGCYLPLKITRRKYQRRMVQFDIPIFKGYVFAQWTADGKIHLQRTNQIVKVLEPQSSIRLLRQLVTIRRMIAGSPEIQVGPQLASGTKVRVKNGPLMGIEGLVEKMKDKLTVVVNIEMIGQSVSVPLDSADVELVS